MAMTHSNPEVGRELLASDLEPRTVVVMVASWCGRWPSPRGSRRCLPTARNVLCRPAETRGAFSSAHQTKG